MVGAFAGSMVWHSLGAYANSRTDGGYVFFFTAQVGCILVEDVVGDVYNKVVGRGERRWWEKAVGYVWTVLWLGVSGLMVFEQQFGRGMILNTFLFYPLWMKWKG